MNIVKLNSQTYRRISPQRFPHIEGAALITSLVFVTVLTLVGVTAMQTTTMQERMAGNSRDHELAFQAAEAMLREAEARVASTVPSNYTSTCANGLCSTGNAPAWKTYLWNDAKAIDYNQSPLHNGTTQLNVSKQPQYFVEYMGMSGSLAGCIAGSTESYRIVARGYGLQNDGTNALARVLLESYFAKC